MRRRSRGARIWSGIAAVLLLATACGTDDGAEPAAAGAGAAAGGGTEATVATAATDLGAILVDGDGRTLYLFDPDEAARSTCNGACAAAWPPVPGPATAGDGVDDALLGTTERDDGSTQATYAGWPLYRYTGDTEAGAVTGQGVEGVWWVLSGAGERLATSDDADDDGDEADGATEPAAPVSPPDYGY